MSNYITLKTELNDKEQYFNYLFNKMKIEKIKVRNNFYKETLIKANNFLSKKNCLFLKNHTILTNNSEESKKHKNIPVVRHNSQKLNIKLEEKKIHSFNSTKKLKVGNSLAVEKNARRQKFRRPTKIHQKYLQILRGVLDKELYNEKYDKDKKRIQDNKKNKTITQRNINNLKESNTEKNKTNMVDIIYGKSLINNCILRDKMIYDIKPLNKSEQKGRCYYPIEDNNDYALTDRNIINISNDIPISEKQIFNKQIEKNINKSINNNNCIKDYNIKRIKEIGEIPLNTILGKDIPQHMIGTNLKTFYGRGSGDMIRGEKIKFIKTCYPVKFIKPILTQKCYVLKSGNLKIDSSNHKNKRNYFNTTDVNSFKRKAQNKIIKNVKKELKSIREKIFKEFNWFDEQKSKLFDTQTKEY